MHNSHGSTFGFSLPLITDGSIKALIHQNANYLLNANSLSINKDLLPPVIPSSSGTYGSELHPAMVLNSLLSLWAAGIERERTCELAYPATLVPNQFSPRMLGERLARPGDS